MDQAAMSAAPVGTLVMMLKRDGIGAMKAPKSGAIHNDPANRASSRSHDDRVGALVGSAAPFGRVRNVQKRRDRVIRTDAGL